MASIFHRFWRKLFARSCLAHWLRSHLVSTEAEHNGQRGGAAGAAAVCKSGSLPGAEIVLAYRSCLGDSWHCRRCSVCPVLVSEWRSQKTSRDKIGMAGSSFASSKTNVIK